MCVANTILTVNICRYYSQNNNGDAVTMPAAVEVMVAGVRLVYPTCYVLVTDYDSLTYNSGGTTHTDTFAASGCAVTKKSLYTCKTLDDVPLMGSDIYHIEPSPFTTSNHPLLGKIYLHTCAIGPLAP